LVTTAIKAATDILATRVPWLEPKNQIRVTIALRDDKGREERTEMTMRVMPKAQAFAALPAFEIVLSLSDPVERQVAAVLQAEITRYDKCGRSAGGLGSVHLVVSGREMTSFGGDGWLANSPKTGLQLREKGHQFKRRFASTCLGQQEC
jgi:hypothetical protein